MQAMDQALNISRAHARVAGEVGRVMTACVGAMFEASMAFAKSSAESNAAMAGALLSAKSPETVVEMQRAMVRNSMQAASVMATRIADACASAAKQSDALAAQAIDAATKSGAVPEKGAP